jgi:hypothetical protein
MEKIQERALRFIYYDYVLKYEELLEKSKLPSLKVRRLHLYTLFQKSYKYFLPLHIVFYQTNSCLINL